MNPKLTKKILRDFPSVFESQSPIIREGFGCEDGWFQLIYSLCREINQIVENAPDYHDNFQVLQVKEKFGGLRFYYAGSDERIKQLIDDAERISYFRCEKCGKGGSLTVRHGFYQTLCKKCAKKEGAKFLPKEIEGTPSI